MALSAKIVETVNPDLLDINFGCPVKKVVSKGAGAGVLKDPDLMVRLTKAVVRSTTLPVTIKTRLGWDEGSINIEDVSERMQDAGVQALSIHARTRCQLYQGKADWSWIARVKDNPRITIPVFGNGDIDSPEKALEYRNRFGVDGIMIGRAAIGYPWIFREIRHFLETGEHLPPASLEERLTVIRKHLNGSVEWKGMTAGINEMKRHYGNYLKGLPNIREFRQRLVTTGSLGEIDGILSEIASAYAGYEFGKRNIESGEYTCQGG
jgi:nifR3 family TIM-barrel protein